MSQTFYPAGYVLTGEYEGKNIYKETNDSFAIVSGDTDNKIVTDSIFSTNFRKLKSISRSNVKCYEDISSVHHGPNMSSVAKGAFWFGAAGALVSAAVSQSNTYDIALEFKDGDKILIRITVGGYYQEFKRIFFDFPTITQSSSPVNSSNENQSVQVSQTSPATALLERAYIFLEDGDFSKADEYFEKVLDLEPKNAKAYVGKLLVDLKITDQNKLSKQNTPNILTENPYFIKAKKYGDKEMVAQLNKYVTTINQRIKKEYERTPQGKYEIATNLFANAVTSDDFMKASTIFEQIPEYMDALAYIKKCHTSSNKAKYQEALDLMNDAKTEAEYEEAANIFKSLHTYKNAEALVEKCFESAKSVKNDDILFSAKKEQEKNTIESYENAIKLFESIRGWKDADIQVIGCQKRIDEIRAQIETERLEKERQEELTRQKDELRAKRIKKITIITTSIVCVIIAFVIVLNTVILPPIRYEEAQLAFSKNDFSEAAIAFGKLGDYKNSKELSYQTWNEIAERQTSMESEYIKATVRNDGTVDLVIYTYKKDVVNYDAVSSWNNVVSIVVDGYGLYALKNDGTVVFADYDPRNMLSPITTWTDVVSIVTCAGGLVGIKTDGTIVANGYFAYYDLRVETAFPSKIGTWKDIVDLDVIPNGTYNETIRGTTKDGKVYEISRNNFH